MIDNPVRRALREGGTSFGTMAFDLFSPGLAAILAVGGAEYVVLDTEHSGIGQDTLKTQIALCRGAGLVPIVRVPGLARHLICPILDAGALGIMLPMVETAAQARDLVSFCRYRPQGTRGLAFGLAHDRYRPADPRTAMDAANDAILTIPMIETVAGLANAREIMDVPGIDLGWLGHFDLTDSMGIVGQFSHPDFLAAEARLLEISRETGKPFGWLAANGAQARAGAARGFRCLCVSTDVALLRDAVTREFIAARAPTPHA
jgi:2-keto-3-deoxy-L-rhamnonate aldolase RhmA